jgi:hypothetical protein
MNCKVSNGHSKLQHELLHSKCKPQFFHVAVIRRINAELTPPQKFGDIEQPKFGQVLRSLNKTEAKCDSADIFQAERKCLK